jgi:ureidoacrylate peracid hydrolase
VSLREPRTALLVVDMTNDFVGGAMAVPGAAELAGRLAPVVEAFRATRLPVVYAVQALRPGGGDLGFLSRFEPVREERALVEGSHGARIVDVLAPQDGDAVVIKRRFSAFLQTDLDLVLRSRGIGRLVIAGVSAHVCCETTARDAAQLGYGVILLGDGTTMGDLPDLGWGAIPAETALNVVRTVIAHRFGEVWSIERLLEELSALEG